MRYNKQSTNGIGTTAETGFFPRLLEPETGEPLIRADAMLDFYKSGKIHT